MGLSDGAVFQDATFAEMQLSDNFTTDKKLRYLLTSIEQTNEWNDLGMGCEALFGQTENQYTHPNIKLDFLPVIDQLSNSNKYFFIVVHFPLHITNILKQWPNAKVISFVNYDSFISNRIHKNLDIELSYKLTQCWKKVADTSWGKAPETAEEYHNLPLRIRKEDEAHHAHALYKIVVDLDSNEFKRVTNKITESKTWNTEGYNSTEETVEHIESLYNMFNLTSVKREYLEQYYNAWINKIF